MMVRNRTPALGLGAGVRFRTNSVDEPAGHGPHPPWRACRRAMRPDPPPVEGAPPRRGKRGRGAWAGHRRARRSRRWCGATRRRAPGPSRRCARPGTTPSGPSRPCASSRRPSARPSIACGVRRAGPRSRRRPAGAAGPADRGGSGGAGRSGRDVPRGRRAARGVGHGPRRGALGEAASARGPSRRHRAIVTGRGRAWSSGAGTPCRTRADDRMAGAAGGSCGVGAARGSVATGGHVATTPRGGSGGRPMAPARRSPRSRAPAP